MGEKISTIVLKVDLECQRCYKKIRKVLCRIQDKMDIKAISYDEKGNTVTIAGPFDAEKVRKKLCCKAGRVIKEMDIKGKGGGGDKPAGKPAEKEGGKPDKAKEGGKADKADKPAEKKEGKAEAKDAKPADKEKPKNAKKVTFEDDAKKEAKAVPKADIGPLLEKILAANKVGPEPPRGEPVAPAAAQGVAVPSIWPAPASSVAGYSYNPSAYDPSSYSYYGGGGGGYGYGYGGCGCGYAPGYCRCGKPAAPPGGYYGVPVYDNQGWYHGGRPQPQSYYAQHQQPCCEDPNAGCSVM